MPRIIPIRDMRDTTKISEMCNATNEPIFITKNGYGDMVVMSMAAYEQQLARVICTRRSWRGRRRRTGANFWTAPQCSHS